MKNKKDLTKEEPEERSEKPKKKKKDKPVPVEKPQKKRKNLTEEEEADDRPEKKRKKSKDPEDDPQPKKKKKEIASYEEMQAAAVIKASLESNLESKKSKKRKKHLEAQKNRKTRGDEKHLAEIVVYLRQYVDDRPAWKFQKTKQIYIQQHAFEFDDVLWPLVLEYLGGSKGKSKDELSAKAEAIIRRIDDESELKDAPELSEQPLYVRARELLQMIQ